MWGPQKIRLQQLWQGVQMARVAAPAPSFRVWYRAAVQLHLLRQKVQAQAPLEGAPEEASQIRSVEIIIIQHWINELVLLPISVSFERRVNVEFLCPRNEGNRRAKFISCRDKFNLI